MTAADTPVRVLGLAEGIAAARDGALVIDVREQEEWDAGHVRGAIHVPLGELDERIRDVVPDRDARVLLYCAVGARSARAAARMARLDYTRVANLAAPIDGWAAAGGAWDVGTDGLTWEQRARFGRQLLLPEIGVAGQRALLAARVVVVGAGGLGSPVSMYLAAAGVGTLVLVDDDEVEVSNLARQVLHPSDGVGATKVDSARRTLHGLNPGTAIETHAERLVAANVDRLIGGADVVVDGTDNLETRYVVNDAAVRLRLPVVHGSVYRWHGQVTTLVPFEGPCYRCLHPEPPPAELAPECAVAGVAGVVPGLVGMLQATETMKLLLGAGAPLVGRLLIVDALDATFEELRIPRDPGCPACGDAGSFGPGDSLSPWSGRSQQSVDASSTTAPDVASSPISRAHDPSSPPER